MALFLCKLETNRATSGQVSSRADQRATSGGCNTVFNLDGEANFGCVKIEHVGTEKCIKTVHGDRNSQLTLARDLGGLYYSFENRQTFFTFPAAAASTATPPAGEIKIAGINCRRPPEKTSGINCRIPPVKTNIENVKIGSLGGLGSIGGLGSLGSLGGLGRIGNLGGLGNLGNLGGLGGLGILGILGGLAPAISPSINPGTPPQLLNFSNLRSKINI